jgi:hypothetical protein
MMLSDAGPLDFVGMAMPWSPRIISTRDARGGDLAFFSRYWKQDRIAREKK